jgi:DNA-binding MarR family transcriptional regulator
MTDNTQTEALAVRCNELMRRIEGLAKSQDSEWLALDVGMGQFKAMVVMKEHGQQCVGSLARALRISEPSTSLLVDRLVTRGLVRRDTDSQDRRRTLVGLTAEGDQLMVRLRQSREDQFIGWLRRLAMNDLQALLRGLEALVGAVRREEGRPEDLV